MKNLLLLLMCIVQVSFAQQNKKLDKLLHRLNKKDIPYIYVDDLANQKDSILLLDSREPKEFKVSHLPTAKFVGYKQFDITTVAPILPKDKNKKIVVYCSLGVRSENVAKKLQKAGYTNVYNLYGGIFEWKNQNYQVVDTLNQTTEKVHTFNKRWSRWLKQGEKVY